MKTKIVTIDENHIDEELIALAAHCIREGGLVAIPTETVYGLGGNALSSDSVRNIYKAKGRPSDNPLIVHIANPTDIFLYGKNISENAQKLMEAFWPGPLTLVVDKQDIIPDAVSGGLSTVAIRCPEHIIMREIIEKSGVPIAAPSANVSGRPSPTNPDHVIEDLDSKIDMIVKAGETQCGIESTIVDVSTEKPVILRPGSITEEMLSAVVGAIAGETKQEGSVTVPKAPGMKYTHYAPTAPVFVYEGEEECVMETMAAEMRMLLAKGQKPVLLLQEDAYRRFAHEHWQMISLGKTSTDVAKRLFAAFRAADKQGATHICVAAIPAQGVGKAVMNRLRKAAKQVIVVAE